MPNAILLLHLNHQGLTLAAIDDIIGRGTCKDWAELRRVAVADPVVLEKILRVSLAHASDPFDAKLVSVGGVSRRNAWLGSLSLRKFLKLVDGA